MAGKVAGSPMNRAEFRAHASNLDALRVLLAEVRVTCQEIGEDQSAFGPMCGWILIGLGDQCARQQRRLSDLEETLTLMAQGLHRIADGDRSSRR